MHKKDLILESTQFKPTKCIKKDLILESTQFKPTKCIKKI